jgi:hypothetical protein
MRPVFIGELKLPMKPPRGKGQRKQSDKFNLVGRVEVNRLASGAV